MFLNTEDFPFARILEEDWQTIRDELLTLTRQRFMVFPERQLYESGWDVFPFYAFGRRLQKNCKLCPETARLLEQVPDLTTAAFSRLEPGTHIKPHVGYQDTVLRYHLGLIVPENCALRVGPETRTWQEGRSLVFDDTTEHEAWNRSDSVRIILIIDFAKSGADFTPPEFIKNRLNELETAAQRGTEKSDAP
jgi:aspartyl/asparaginyl beta-hydroxylase (cupin superfamily)